MESKSCTKIHAEVNKTPMFVLDKKYSGVCQERVHNRVGHPTLQPGPSSKGIVFLQARDLRPPHRKEGFHTVLRCKGDHDLSEAVALLSCLGTSGASSLSSPSSTNMVEIDRAPSAPPQLANAPARGSGDIVRGQGTRVAAAVGVGMSVPPWQEKTGVQEGVSSSRGGSHASRRRAEAHGGGAEITGPFVDGDGFPLHHEGHVQHPSVSSGWGGSRSGEAFRDHGVANGNFPPLQSTGEVKGLTGVGGYGYESQESVRSAIGPASHMKRHNDAPRQGRAVAVGQMKPWRVQKQSPQRQDHHHREQSSSMTPTLLTPADISEEFQARQLPLSGVYPRDTGISPMGAASVEAVSMRGVPPPGDSTHVSGREHGVDSRAAFPAFHDSPAAAQLGLNSMIGPMHPSDLPFEDATQQLFIGDLSDPDGEDAGQIRHDAGYPSAPPLDPPHPPEENYFVSTAEGTTHWEPAQASPPDTAIYTSHSGVLSTGPEESWRMAQTTPSVQDTRGIDPLAGDRDNSVQYSSNTDIPVGEGKDSPTVGLLVQNRGGSCTGEGTRDGADGAVDLGAPEAQSAELSEGEAFYVLEDMFGGLLPADTLERVFMASGQSLEEVKQEKMASCCGWR